MLAKHNNNTVESPAWYAHTCPNNQMQLYYNVDQFHLIITNIIVNSFIIILTMHDYSNCSKQPCHGCLKHNSRFQVLTRDAATLIP